MPQRDFDSELRAGLRAGLEYGAEPVTGVDVDDLLARVHRGARVRRARRATFATAVVVALFSGTGYAMAGAGLFEGAAGPVASDRQSADERAAGQTSPTPSPDTGSASPGSAREAERSVSASADAGAAKALRAGSLRSGRALSLDPAEGGRQWQLVASVDLAGSTSPCTPARPCAAVFASGDDGRTWRRLADLPAAPGLSGSEPDTVNSVRVAADGANGWAYGGDLFATHDAGESWHRPALPVDGMVPRLEVTSDVAIAAVRAPAGDALLRSPVDADDWTEVTPEGLTRVVDLATNDADVVVLDSVDPADQRLLVSTDEGSTWQRPQTCVADDVPAQVSATDESLWLVCDRYGGHRVSKYVRVSTDDGRTWRTVPGTFRAVAVAGVTSDTAVVVPNSGLAGTGSVTRVGVDERPVRLGPYDLGQLKYVGFTDPDTGYLLDYDGTLLRTTDGGHSWHRYAIGD